MTLQPVLIAGFSARALAQSARKAGFAPLVVDGYGDLDTRSAAQDIIVLPEIVRRGFRAGDLLDALGKLSAASAAPPAGLLLGAGFEGTPKLIETLARQYRLLGCSPQSVANVKDPAVFFPLLAEIGIPHPATLLPAQKSDTAGPGDWLSKRIGGMGGTHIRRWQTGNRLSAKRYLQQQIPGEPLSATVLATRNGPAFAFTRSWLSPTPDQPFRFGGIVGNITLESELEARLIDLILTLLPRLELTGLVSFDFIQHDGELFLLEVNPRPGASLDVLDDDAGTLLSAHVLAVTGGDAIATLAADWQPVTRASAYLYADQGALTAPQIDWPDWAHDRPAPGCKIPAGAPVATVHAQAATPEDAELKCRNRLEQLRIMLYED